VLVTTATTGEGIPKLLDALDQHRSTGRASADGARIARAEAQVWAILGDRLRAALRSAPRSAETDRTLAAVAAHELDPFTAADRLLETLRR
jgi:LAO/AO transport system kinase